MGRTYTCSPGLNVRAVLMSKSDGADAQTGMQSYGRVMNFILVKIADGGARSSPDQLLKRPET